jgi:hypothetical protein
MGQLVEGKVDGKPKEPEESHPSATLSMTYSRWPDLESKPGSGGEEPASSRLSYGTHFVVRSLIESNETASYYSNTRRYITTAAEPVCVCVCVCACE